MFGHNPFYWASMRKVMAVFGSMFNDIRIQRTDENGNPVKVFTVPIEFAQREHFIARLYEDSRLTTGLRLATTTPRLSYEFVSAAYRPETKLQTSRYIIKEKTINDDRSYKMLNPVPYTMNIDLSLYTRTLDDALQILEQILPFFCPSVAVTINEIPELGLKNDIIYQLDGFNTTTTVEGGIEEERTIIWTLNFSAKMNVYHPITDPKIIKEVIANIDVHEDLLSPDMIITQVVNPFTADEGDVWTVDKTIEEP